MTKICTKCQTEKPISEYHKRTQASRGLDAWCKSCKTEYRKSYYLKNKEYEKLRSRIKIWKALGINFTEADYIELCLKQKYQCAICTKTVERFHVDHDHKTDKVRGLLCPACNKALGYFKDNIGILNAAIKYLNDTTLSNS